MLLIREAYNRAIGYAGCSYICCRFFWVYIGNNFTKYFLLNIWMSQLMLRVWRMKPTSMSVRKM